MRWTSIENMNLYNALKDNTLEKKDSMLTKEMKTGKDHTNLHSRVEILRKRFTASNASPNRQLWMLFISGNIILFVGMGLFPLLPLLDAQLGASRTSIGLHYALMYAAYGMGPLAVGKFSGRVNRKTLFVIGALTGLLALVFMTRAASFWQVVILTSLVWFAGGLNNALISILTSVHAKGNLRGRWFSLMSISVPIGSLIGGWMAGKLIAANGYAFLFAVQAVVWTGLLIVGFFGLMNPALEKTGISSRKAASMHTAGEQLQGFAPLLVLALLSGIAINATRLGSSLSMQALSFTAPMIASTATLSGLVAIPLTLLVGVLADRFERKKMLMITILATAVGAVTLAAASQLWQFSVAAILVLVAFCTNRALTSAVAADLLDKTQLDQGMAKLNATGAASSVISFASAGIMIDAIGTMGFFLLTALMAVASISTLVTRRGEGVEPCASCPNPA